MKTTTVLSENSILVGPLRRAFLLIPLVLICFGLSLPMQAVNPAPDGGYPGGNTAEGTNALFSLTTGAWNTASGFEALRGDTSGGTNTAVGYAALFHNLGGDGDTAVGSRALVNNVSGSHNIALGGNAGSNIITGSNNIDIGNGGNAADTDTIRIGTEGTQTKTFIAGIYGSTARAYFPVYITAAGQLTTTQSSRRFKSDIKPMDKTSEAILALQPVTFRYKQEIDPEGIPQFGLVAEDVEKINPDLVARDAKGQIYTVRYDAVNAMLLNEFLKEHRKVEKLEATADQQAKEIKELKANLKVQATQIQKVSAQLEMSKPAPQVVVQK